jgi:hypothetical protein
MSLWCREKLPAWAEFARSGLFAATRIKEHLVPVGFVAPCVINKESDFHRFGFQFAGVKCRLVNKVRPFTQNQ